jgi:hypothetical protein
MIYKLRLIFCVLRGWHRTGYEQHWKGRSMLGYGPCKTCGTWHWFGPY